ncbi:hypothetical protein EVAR_57633_1 [Eumeta japonica]|uniref:RNA-directed DNA polymerase from mobile element jockey n=1 Tax=Eumeta variegata TaxID=151549 RepID=A0A4C1ZR67_EUMVA|nr:hypothetical protein EVAR_57633_1 [Eumeta japonica]
MEDAERQGYEVLGPDTPMHFPTNPRYRTNILDIVLGYKIRWPMHIEVVYGMDAQHLPILVTVGTDRSNSPPATWRQRMDWENFRTSLETLHLGSSFETVADMEASANILIDRRKEAQAKATTFLPTLTSRRGDLSPSIKRRLWHKRRFMLQVNPDPLAVPSCKKS